MEHESLREEIPAYAAGRLGPESREQLERHLAGCAPCRDLATTWTELARELREGGEEMLHPHPAAAELRAHARGAADEGGGIARHLDVCATCSLEVTAWRRRAPASRWGRSSFGVIGLAAGLLLGVGLVFLVLGPGTPRPWGGPVELLTLDAPLRGDQIDEIHLAEGQPYAPIAVTFDLPAAATRIEFIVQDDHQNVRWTSASSADLVAAQLQRIGVVTLLVPAADLAGESFRLIVRDDGGATRLDVPFRLLRDHPGR